jgi:hypothetical protein
MLFQEKFYGSYRTIGHQEEVLSMRKILGVI